MATLSVQHPIEDFNPALLWQGENTRYVSKNGLDTNDGLTKYTPLLTIQAAIDDLVSSTGFSVVRIEAGAYAENVVLKDNAAGAGISLFGDPGSIISPTTGTALSVESGSTAEATWFVNSVIISVSGAGPHQPIDLDGSGDPANDWVFVFRDCTVGSSGTAGGPLVNVDSVTGDVIIDRCSLSTEIAGQRGIVLDGGVAAIVLNSEIFTLDANVLLLQDNDDNVETGQTTYETTDDAAAEYALHVVAGSLLAADCVVIGGAGLCATVLPGGAADQSFLFLTDCAVEAGGDHPAGNTMLVGNNTAGATVTPQLIVTGGSVTGIPAAEGGAGGGIGAVNGCFVAVRYSTVTTARETLVVLSPANTTTFASLDGAQLIGEGDGATDVVQVTGGPAGAGSAVLRVSGATISAVPGSAGAGVIAVATGGSVQGHGLRLEDNTGTVTNELIVDGTSSVAFFNSEWDAASIAATTTLATANNPKSPLLTIPMFTAPPAAATTFIFGNPASGTPALVIDSDRPTIVTAVTLMLDGVVTDATGTITVNVISDNGVQPARTAPVAGGAGSDFQASIPLSGSFMLRPGDGIQVSITLGAGDVVPVGTVFLHY